MCPTVLFSPAPLHFFLTSTAPFQIKRKENNLIPLFIKRCFLSFFKLGLFLRRKKIILQRNFIFFILYFNFKKLLYFLYFSKWRRNRGRWNKYVRKEIDVKYYKVECYKQKNYFQKKIKILIGDNKKSYMFQK